MDNTRFIPTLEHIGKQMILTRPPRWGKSLLQSMLSVYYDKNTSADEFHELFNGLDVGNQPTALARSFYVLPLDLTVDTSDRNNICQLMFDSINGRIESFVARYDLPEIKIHPRNGNESLSSLAEVVRQQNGQLYLLIDEYDRFSNKLMFEDPDLNRGVVMGQSGDPYSSPLRSFLETVKKIQPARTLITGITGIALADASGANIFDSMSLDPNFGSIVGFTEKDIRRALSDLHLDEAATESAV